MRAFIRSLCSDNSAASAGEYALMIAFISGVVVLGAIAVGANVKTVFADFAPKVATPA